MFEVLETILRKLLEKTQVLSQYHAVKTITFHPFHLSHIFDIIIF